MPPPTPPDPIPPSPIPPPAFKFVLGTKKRPAPSPSTMNVKKNCKPASTESAPDLSAYPASLRPALLRKLELDQEWTARVEIAAALDRFVDNALPHRESAKFGDLAKSLGASVKALAADFLQIGAESEAAPLPAKPVTQVTPASLPPAPRAQHQRTTEPPRPKTAVQDTGVAQAATKPQPPAPATATWAVVARRGAKKARNNITSEPTHGSKATPASSAGPKTQEKKGNGKNEPDPRIFLRLAPDHAWRKLSPAGARDALSKALGTRYSWIDKVQAVKSGFAITAADQTARAEMLKLAGQEKLSQVDARLEERTSWVALMVPSVPTSIRTVNGKVEVTEELVKNEVERVTRLRPTKASPMGKIKENSPPSRTWTCLFEQKAPAKGFRIFDESGKAFEKKERPRTAQCARCLDFHSTRGCSRPPACKNCGSIQHAEEECRALSKCRNCGGPHRSDSRSCLARPFSSGERPAGTQLQMIRQGGQRAYNKALKEHTALLASTQPVATATAAAATVAAATDAAATDAAVTDAVATNATVPNATHPPAPAPAPAPAVQSTEAPQEALSSAPPADAVDVAMSS